MGALHALQILQGEGTLYVCKPSPALLRPIPAPPELKTVEWRWARSSCWEDIKRLRPR